MKILVCGSRDWDDEQIIHILLDGILVHAVDDEDIQTLTIIDGTQRGADTHANNWVEQFKEQTGSDFVAAERYEPEWDNFGKAAGHIRNKQMLEEGKPDVVFAFADDLEVSVGTRNMITQASKTGVPVYRIERM